MNEKPQNIYISKMENSTVLDKTGWPVGVWLRWSILHHSTSADEGGFLNNSSNAFGVGQNSPRFSHLNAPYLNTLMLCMASWYNMASMPLEVGWKFPWRCLLPSDFRCSEQSAELSHGWSINSLEWLSCLIRVGPSKSSAITFTGLSRSQMKVYLRKNWKWNWI